MVSRSRALGAPLTKGKPTDYQSIDYYPFEEAMLQFMTEIKPSDIAPQKGTFDNLKSAYDKADGKLSDVVEKIRTLQASLEDDESGFDAGVELLRKLDMKRQQLTDQREALELQMNGRTNLPARVDFHCSKVSADRGMRM